MPGKRERVQVLINADVENRIGKTRMITPKAFGPFTMKMPKMSNDDLCTFIVYTKGGISYIPWCIASYYIINLLNARDPISSTGTRQLSNGGSDLFSR